MLHQDSHMLRAFTLVEIVVAATILVILSSIGFYSYTQNISSARDSSRISDLSSLGSQLNLYKRSRGAYPFPGDRFNLVNDSIIVAYQGKMNTQVALTTASGNLPVDPELKIPYVYSTTRNRQEYQIAGSIENSDSPYTFLQGDYRSVSRNILPNIALALQTSSDTDITLPATQSLFLFHRGYNTLPYDFESGAPYNDGSTLSEMLANAGDDYWQNTDLRSCEEINIAGKNITGSGSPDQEYQILDSNGVLQSINCPGIL